MTLFITHLVGIIVKRKHILKNNTTSKIAYRNTCICANACKIMCNLLFFCLLCEYMLFVCRCVYFFKIMYSLMNNCLSDQNMSRYTCIIIVTYVNKVKWFNLQMLYLVMKTSFIKNFRLRKITLKLY